MKTNLILLLIFLVSLTSCNFLIKQLSGFNDPKIESFHSINQYAQSLRIDTSIIVYPKSLSCLNKLNSLFRGYPEILIFDNLKNFLPYKNDSVACNAPVDNILSAICDFASSDIETGKRYTYDSIISCLTDPNKILDSYNIVDVDCIVFVSLQKYSHGLNKTHLIPWNEIINTSKHNCTVQFVFVDLDYLNVWDINKKDLPVIKYKFF